MVQQRIVAPVTGSVLAHSASVGARVFAGAVVLVLESMKLEISIESPWDGEVIWLAPMGDAVQVEETIAIISTAA